MSQRLKTLWSITCPTHLLLTKQPQRVTSSDTSTASEIYKKYPMVNSVIHSHAHAVIPYSITGIEQYIVKCSQIS